MIADRERTKYRRMYQEGIYKGPGAGKDHVGAAIEALGMKPGESVVDYGCGPGCAGAIFQDRGFRALNMDIVGDGVDADCLSYIPFIAAPIWDLPEDFPITDWAFSTKVLEHLPTEKIDDSLKAVADHTARGAFLHVHHEKDVMGRYINDTLHLTVQPPEWWAEKIGEYFDIVDVQTIRHGGNDNVSSFICLSKDEKDTTLIPLAHYLKNPDVQSDRTVCIIGHGPSMKDSGLGEVIDSYDTVIRFGGRKGQTAADFGVKTDFIMASQRYHADIINDGIKPIGGTWIMTRPGAMDSEQARYMIHERLRGYNAAICREVWPWLYRYQEMGATGYIDPRLGAPGLIPSFTQGTAAIIATCHRVTPRRIVLAGFDNVWAGTRERYTEVRALAEGEAPRTSGHDIEVERKLIDRIAEYYGVEIRAIHET